MKNMRLVLLACCASVALAQDCPVALTPSYSRPVLGSGWTARLIVSDLTDPRSLLFDASGKLLVVEQKSGIRRLGFADRGGNCLELTENNVVIDDTSLTHGIALSNDGKTLFASSAGEVYAWAYDADSGTISGDKRIIINNMSNSGHSTRTLLMSQKVPGTLLVSQGSSENVDDRALDKSTGISQIRAFDVSSLPDEPLDYASNGLLLGWGLRNSVGVSEEPTTGGIYSVENSVDQLSRDGVDVHQNNPGEELNFHGFLNGTTVATQGGNHGYPRCFALWDTDIPNAGALETGDQFVPTADDVTTDSVCGSEFVAPRLTFQAHTAPLDIKFTPDGKTAYVTFHGSWNRDEPAGYKLSRIAFADGSPESPANSTTSLADMMSNPDLSQCPDSCFRPVGLALDGKDRLFMSSDATGEIWVLVAGEVTTGTIDGPATSASPSPSSKPSNTGGSLVEQPTPSNRAHAVLGRGIESGSIGATVVLVASLAAGLIATGFGAWFTPFAVDGPRDV